MSFPLGATSGLGQPKDFGSVLVSPLVPLIATIPNVESALRVTEALQKAGLLQIEITFRSTEAPQALRAVVREFPEMTVGAGTLLTPQQVHQARDAGARFGVAPGSNPRVLKAAREAGLPFLPGVATPTEIELALEQGYLWQKIPGILGNFDSFLGWIHGAYAHTGLRVVPAGGDNLRKSGRTFTASLDRRLCRHLDYSRFPDPRKEVGGDRGLGTQV